MSELSKLIAAAKVPAVFKGKVTEADRAAMLDNLARATAGVRAGEARAVVIERILAALIGAAGDTIPAYMAMRAAEAGRKAAEAHLAETHAEDAGGE